MTLQPLKFKFSGKMARLLGRESVSSDTAALFELVKNGYDADASKVTVMFENLVANGGDDARIIVEDSGDGMTHDDIVDKWMVIGTYSKDRKTTTRGGRTVVGNKGVGRFATEKLARRVVVESRPRASNEEIRLEIDWTKFEDEGIKFEDVEIPIEISPCRPEPSRHGLRITLTGLREKWDAKKIQRLSTSVSSIVLPKELHKQGDGFEVEIHADEFKRDIPLHVESLLLKKAPYALSAVLPDKESRTTVQIKKKGSFVDNKVVECGRAEMDSGNAWKPFGGCEIQVYVYPHDTKYEAWNMYYSDVLKLSHVRAVIRENHGLKIYRDGFWVSPYGGPGNDWAGLDAARVQSNLKTGNSQIIGFVKITKKKNEEIRDTTSRERLEENAAFESMRYFVWCVFNEFYHFRKDEAKKQGEQKPKIHVDLLHNRIKHLEVMIDDNQQLDRETKKSMKTSLRRINKSFALYQKQSRAEYTELEEQERMYRNLASLGISSAASYHEIFNIVADMEETPEAIKNKLADLHVGDKELDKFVNGLDVAIGAISHYVWFIRKFIQNIGGAVDKPKKEKLGLKREIESLLNDFAELSNTNVELTVRCYPEDLIVFMNRTDFLSLMLNMLTNSLRALDRQNPDMKRIQVTASKAATGLEIRFSDNGAGIDDYLREKVFRALFTTYEGGTGMGLSIIAEILDGYGGKIELLSGSELDNGATFLLQIPWENVKNE